MWKEFIDSLPSVTKEAGGTGPLYPTQVVYVMLGEVLSFPDFFFSEKVCKDGDVAQF